MGAIAGTAIGAAAHNPVAGALIGAGTGAVVGGAVGNLEDKKEARGRRRPGGLREQCRCGCCRRSTRHHRAIRN